MRQVVAKETNFAKCKMTSADMRYGDFESCTFTEANLQQANLENANMTETVLTNTQLDRANLQNVRGDIRVANANDQNRQ